MSANFIQTFFGAEAPVSIALFDQILHVFRIQVEPLGLAIRAESAAGIRAFVASQAEPIEAAAYGGFRALDTPGPVGVLQTQDEHATCRTGVDEIEEGYIGSAYVRVSGRAGGDPQAFS
jgi:hypothetical protein